jgi:hypothetical protein
VEAGNQAIRVGDLKLFPRRKNAAIQGGTGPVLFNLVEDGAETADLSGQHPERVKAMQALAEKRLVEIRENSVLLGRVAR